MRPKGKSAQQSKPPRMVPVVNVVIMIITITANARGEGREGGPPVMPTVG